VTQALNRPPKRGNSSDLTVISIGTDFCPVFVSATVFRTEADESKVSRTSSGVDLEFGDDRNTFTVHLALQGSPPYVDKASGVVVTKAPDGVRSSELVAFVAGTKGISGREFAHVDLKCAKIGVVAAKRPAK